MILNLSAAAVRLTATNDNARPTPSPVSAAVSATFEVGKTYGTRSPCDYDCIFVFTVVKRTAKSVWLSQHGQEAKRRSIRLYDGAESVLPYGSYSMAAVLRADARALSLGGE